MSGARRRVRRRQPSGRKRGCAPPYQGSRSARRLGAAKPLPPPPSPPPPILVYIEQLVSVRSIVSFWIYYYTKLWIMVTTNFRKLGKPSWLSTMDSPTGLPHTAVRVTPRRAFLRLTGMPRPRAHMHTAHPVGESARLLFFFCSVVRGNVLAADRETSTTSTCPSAR